MASQITSSRTLSTALPKDWAQRLERVPNARDLAEACPKIHAGRIFRSGSPAHATISDVRLVRSELKVQQMIDLRSAEERAEDKSWPVMLSNGIIKTYDDKGNLVKIAVDDHPELSDLKLEPIELHRLSLLERNRFVKSLVWKLPYQKLALAGIYKALGWQESMRDVIIPELNKGGLQLIYEILLETAGPDIAETLDLIADAAVKRHPQMIFCKLGKDRTGVLSALILSACGATDEEIITDYARSDGVNQIALGGLEKMKDVQGMDPKIFASAPPEAMEKLLQWSKERYGGLRGYMTSVGFDLEKQRKLCHSLTAS